MRLGLAVLVLATTFAGGCSPQGDDGYSTYYPPGDTQPENGCKTDSDCLNSNVCARDGECLPADEVTHVVATWTVAGSAASDASCAQEPDLEIDFATADESGDGVGFAPVPCNEGKFNVDKMPSRFTVVSLGNENDSDTAPQSGTLDGSGAIHFDLPSE